MNGIRCYFYFFSEGEAEVKLLMCCSERLRRERVRKGKGVDGSSRAARDCMQDPFLYHFFSLVVRNERERG